MKYPNLTKAECVEWDRLCAKMGMENMAAQAVAFQSIKELAINLLKNRAIWDNYPKEAEELSEAIASTSSG